MDRITVKKLDKIFYLTENNSKTLFEHIVTRGKKREINAIKDVSFSVASGECVGIIGRNGSGKSTLLKLIAGILKPTYGSIEINGNLMPLLDLSFGFDAELSGPQNIKMFGSLLGLSKEEIEKKIESIVEYFGFPEFINSNIKYYSDGMKLRLAFATVMATNPEIILIDEALMVGDASFQRRCQAKIIEFRAEKKTLVLVSHSLELLSSICDRIILLDHGKIIKEGEPAKVIRYYRNMIENEDKSDIDHRLEEKEALITIIKQKKSKFDSLNNFEEAKKMDLLITELNHEILQYINENIILNSEKKSELKDEIEIINLKIKELQNNSLDKNTTKEQEKLEEKLKIINAKIKKIEESSDVLLEKGMLSINDS